jgi:hypothetical protein
VLCALGQKPVDLEAVAVARVLRARERAGAANYWRLCAAVPGWRFAWGCLW